ncbi:MAG: outer membrane lipoprotein carrier protein LolA [Spirochaetaceae bacterium]|nr:outer membrane lipoprotein carrier protein LolA [Spirochaetaceae bacterium]
MKRLFAILGMLLCLVFPAVTQEIVTAEQFFGKVSERYASINDYEASILINSGGQAMSGDLWFKSPQLMRIDFRQPPEQVIVFDGQRLIVYIPQYKAVLQQETGTDSLGAGAATLASREGLAMMKRNYSIAWEASPQAVPLDQGSEEMVQRLVLTRKAASEGFKSIRISILPASLLFRRIEGWTVANEKISFDFTQTKLNQNIPTTRFLYDAPASANVYNNFLFQ